MDLPSQDPSDPAQLDGGLPEVSSTPCFIVLDSQAEATEADRGEESVTEARARRLKQLEELTKNPPTKPLLEMELDGAIQRSGDKEDDNKESTSLMTSVEGIEVKAQTSQNDEASSSEEEEDEAEEENEVPSTQEDLFDEENKLPNEQGTGDFRSPSTSKDDSHLKRTPSEELHTTPTSRDASHIIGTPSEDVHTTPTSRDASHIIGTPSEDAHTTPTSRDASHIIGTPSETVSSLRFSGIVLANETSTSGSSASINVVYPSPEAYGPAPIIIPSTPTRPDTSNEELIELSDNDDMPRATLPEAPLKRKSTNTSEESEDVYGIPAWQQELNQLQKRKEEEVNTQDSWLKDNSGSKRSMSTSIDSTNPSSEHSENLHKSSAELEESLSLQQQQPLMGSTTDESSRQSANSRPPSATIVGNGTKDRVSHSDSAPLLGDTGARTGTKHSSGSSQKGQASLPGDAAYDAKHPVTKEQSGEPCTTGQATDFEKTSAEMKTQFDDGTRLNVNVKRQEKRHGDVVLEPDIEIIDDDYEDEEEEEDKRDDAEAELGVDPSQDWHLQLSPSQTQTQTQYSSAHRELGIKDVMSERDLSQIESKAVEEEEDAQERKTTRLKGDGKTNVSRQGTPWHSTQAEDVDDDEVSMVIPESEKLCENKENDGRGKQKLSDPDDGGEKAMKEGSKGKFGEGMEDSVFLEGDAQLPDEGRLRLGQLGESDNPSPIAGFHLSVPKDGALLRPLSSMTPHLGKKGQWRTDGTPRHSTPIADETEGSSSQREVLSTADKETPKTTSKSSSALVVSAVIEMDSSENSEIPAFNLRNPTDCSELLKEAKESPSKRQKSVFSRVVEATKAAKSNTRTKKQTAPTDKDPFSLTNPKTKLILGKKRNQQSLPQGDQPQGTTNQASKGKRGKEIAIEEEHGDEREAPGVEVEEDNSATIPLDYQGEDPRTECPDVEVVEEMTAEELEILKTMQKETQQYGANDEQEAEVEMEIDAEEEEEIEEGKKEDERIEEVEEIPLKGQQQVFVSQERRRDPYEFTESQSNKTPTPMKTWARKEDTVPKEKLPLKNLSEVSSTKPTTEQPSTTAAVTLKTKRTPKGSRQNRGAKRKRPQDLETTEEEGDNSALNRTRTSPRKKASSTVRKVPKKRGKILEKQQSKGQTAKVLTEKPPYVSSPSMTQRIVQDPVPVAAERRLQASPASLELRQIPGHSPPLRQPPPWKIVRYKKVNITQRIKEVIEWGEIVETTILEQVVNEEIIEKLEQDFMTPSPRSKTSSLTSGSLADISSLGSRTSSSVAGSFQKSSSILSTGIQKSISLSSISEGNSSLDKTISLPGSEKTSPNVSGHEQSSSGGQLMSPGGVVPQRIPSRGTRASPGVSRNQDSSRVSPMDTQRRSFTGGTEHPPGISEQNSRTGQVRSSDVSPSALMLSRRMSSKGSKSSSDAEARMVPDGKDAQFVKPKRTPSRRRVSRTPEQAEQSTHEQGSNVRMDPPPELNLSEGWNVEQVQQSSEESEGIPCAQPRTEMERISSDETVEKSDGDVGKQTTTTTGDSLEEKVDDPEPSTSNQEGSSTRPTRGKRRSKAEMTTPTRQSLDDTIIVQDEDGDQDVILSEPPQESMQQPSAGNASSTSGLTTDSAQAFLVPGVRVFTRWMDGFYYPGTIKKEEKNNRLKIAFDDGDMRSVNTKDVIIKDWLSTGQSVMAESAEDGYNYPGIVIGYFRGSNPKDAGYFVETDNGQTTRYPRKKVILSKDQANLLLTSCPSSSSTGISDISLENLISGTRQRSRLRAPDGGGVVRTPSKVLGRTPRHDLTPAVTRSGGKRKATAEKQPAETGDVSPRKKAKQLAKRLRTIVTASPDLGKQGIGIRRSPRKQPPSTSSTPGSPARGLFPATRGGPPSTPRTMEMLLGPLPRNRTLFKGMAFFLTQGEVKKRAKVDTSTSESELEDDADEAPFDKDHARKQIEAGGGVVLKDFDKSQKTQYKLSLVANTYCRTKKYFLALAFNIPCVSNLWIRDCSRTGKLQSHKAYLLPAGESVNGNIMEWKPNRCILSGLKIMVISSHIEVENTWRSILMVAGCHIVARFPTTNELNRGGIPFDCSVMVTDPSCPRHILHRAQQLDIPVVSVEWVMQSLINGVRMPYDSHDKFIWDYKEKLK